MQKQSIHKLSKVIVKNQKQANKVVIRFKHTDVANSNGNQQQQQPTIYVPNTFGVIGAGQMGTGIAIVAAMNAKIPNVKVMDAYKESIVKSKNFVNDLLTKYESKNKITKEEKQKILEERITYTNEISGLKECEFVVEAATENTELKLNIFKELSSIAKEDAILASNTSSISITKIAAATQRPNQVIGMHFMNPVPVMKLVEVIRGLQTDDLTLQKTLQLSEALGKTTTLSKDVPGFIANRILMPYINEAIQTLYEGISTKEDIDKTMLLGTNVPMGPLTLADFIGLDTCLSIMRVLYNEFSDSKYRPSPLLVKMVEAGWLGKKTGKGFYDYNK
ncbi:hypothetical protein ABK040_003922 [Willaertia magna]